MGTELTKPLALAMTKATAVLNRVPSRWARLPAVAALLLVGALAGAGCRRYSPPPPLGTGGNTAQTGGTGGSKGTGGTSGSGPADARPPDTTPEVAPPDIAPACGKAGQTCCPGNRCLEGGCCEEGVCTSHGNSCELERSASCLSSRCSNDCGGPGMRCCGGAKRNCTFPLTICDGPSLGTCVACGGMGQPCCRDNYCDKVMCMNGRCGPPATPSDAGTDATTDAPKDAPVDAPRG
jgi:hypothetical protein